MNPQPQSAMKDYSMSGRTQDPRLSAQVSGGIQDTAEELYCQDTEDTIDDLFNKFMSTIHPEVLASVKAEEADLDEFTMDAIEMEPWQTDISLSLEQNVSQQLQWPQCYEERN